MGSNPAAPTIFSFENKGKSPAPSLAAESQNGTEGRRSAEIGTESPEKSPKGVQQAFYDENDWSAPDVIIHHQPRTKVYTNINDQVVIRQERDWCENDDPFVYFSRENVPALIAALQDIIA